MGGGGKKRRSEQYKIVYKQGRITLFLTDASNVGLKSDAWAKLLLVFQDGGPKLCGVSLNRLHILIFLQRYLDREFLIFPRMYKAT